MNQATAHAAHVFLQLAIIIGACRLCGYAMKRVGQPQVIGEMVAGVLLGPSLLGAILPEVFAKIFPTTDKPVLFARADRATNDAMTRPGGPLIRSAGPRRQP